MATLQNIGKLKYRGKDGQWHPLPVVVQDADGSVSTISGKGAPTSATQGAVNQLYRDEDTQRLYICTATDGGYTWAAVSGGSVDVDATLTKAGYAADAKAAGDAIGKKLDKAQGVENAGMILGVGEDGNVVPGDPSNLPGLVSYSKSQELTYEQQALAKKNIGAGTLRNVYYWRANGTPENPNGVLTCAIKGDTCICGGKGDSLPDGMQAPVLVIYGSIDRGYRDATAFDGSNATWTFTVNLRDYSYSTPIKKSGVPTPATAQVGQIVKVKAVDESGNITETEAVDMPSGGAIEKPWRILRDIMITETVSDQTPNVTYYTNNNGKVRACEFSTDEDNTTFSISEIVVVGILENLETTGTGCGIGVFNGTYLGNQEITYIREGLVTGKKQTIYIHAYNLFGKYTMTDFYSFQHLQKTGFQGSWNNLSDAPAFNDTSKMLDAWKPRSNPPWTKLAIGTGGQGISGRIVIFAR